MITCDAMPTPSAVRSHCAAVSRQLIESVPSRLASISWDELGAAPRWLAWPAEARQTWCLRIGALAYAQAMNGWIDAQLLAGVREQVGSAWLAALLGSAAGALPVVHEQLLIPVHKPRHVAPALQAVGGAVLAAAAPSALWQVLAREMLCLHSGSAPAWPHDVALALCEAAQTIAQSQAPGARP